MNSLIKIKDLTFSERQHCRRARFYRIDVFFGVLLKKKQNQFFIFSLTVYSGLEGEVSDDDFSRHENKFDCQKLSFCEFCRSPTSPPSHQTSAHRPHLFLTRLFCGVFISAAAEMFLLFPTVNYCREEAKLGNTCTRDLRVQLSSAVNTINQNVPREEKKLKKNFNFSRKNLQLMGKVNGPVVQKSWNDRQGEVPTLWGLGTTRNGSLMNSRLFSYSLL